jgi:diguanylate cyclase (GGDEF)-like protein/PAS domain S-box-containing protein
MLKPIAPKHELMNKPDFNFQDIVEAAQDVVIVTRADPIDSPGPEIVYVNPAFTRLTGYTPDEVIGKNPRILQSTGTDEATKRTIRQALEQKIPVRTTIKNYSKSGEEYWLDLSILPLKNSSGEVTHFVAIERDTTAQKELELKLETLSKTDSLTGLLNRRAFTEIINSEFSRFNRAGKIFSVLLLDIDHFKGINDSYGHNMGDRVLEYLGTEFKKLLRPYDYVARMGGEEFCILLPDTSQNQAIETAERIRNIILATSIPTDENTLNITVSIGVSESLIADTHYTQILERADQALYRAKDAGRNCVRS